MQQLKKLDSITVISSAICNLNCSFCFLHKNSAYKQFNKLVDQAWKDGTYLKNIETTIKKLNYDPETTDEIQIWGGETLLGVKNLQQNLSKIYNLFPNLTKWQFSTNFTGMIDEFFQFLIDLDKIANIKTEIFFQISIDGPPGPISEAGHNGGWETYRKNLLKFSSLINNHKFHNINIHLVIHPTISKDLYLKELSTYEGMRDYMVYMNNFSKEILNACISESLHFNQALIYPNMATPYEDSSEDGRLFAKILKLWDEVYRNEFFTAGDKFEPGFFYGISDFSKDVDFSMGNSQCRELGSGLTVNYDGSICECSGSFINTFEPYLQEFNNPNHTYEYYEAIVHNKMSGYNPHDLDKIDIERHLWALHEGGYRYVKTTYIHMLMNLAEEMAKSNQILKKYAYDKDLLFRHCWLFLNGISCSRNNIGDTRNPYITPVGAIRRFFNGAMDYIEERVTYDKKQIIQIKMSEDCKC